MNYVGSCKCGRWKIGVSIDAALGSLSPRVCDCDYCRLHPSGIVSHPQMLIQLKGESSDVVVNRNGDRLAGFYHCRECGELLAVGCEIDGRFRGAVNGFLLERKHELGQPVPIQPRLLSAPEKLARWKELWGSLRGA